MEISTFLSTYIRIYDANEDLKAQINGLTHWEPNGLAQKAQKGLTLATHNPNPSIS